MLWAGQDPSGIQRVVYGEKYRITDGIDLLKKAGIETIECKEF